MFDGSRNALHHEPRRLEQDKGFSEPVALSLVLDFCFGRYSKRGEVNVDGCIIPIDVASSKWMEGVSSCDMPIYVSLEPRSKRWKPPIIIKNP